MSDLVHIHNPDTGGTGVVGPRAFELVWSQRGFELHDPKDPDTCDVCGFEAATAGGLATHKRTHNDSTEE